MSFNQTIPSANIPKPEDKVYTTRDLQLAAALLTMKFQIVDMNLQYEGSKQIPTGYFTFENSADLIKAINLYLSRQMLVEPSEYNSNIRNLKSQVVSAAKNPLS